MDDQNRQMIETVENVMRLNKIINDNETIYDFLKQPSTKTLAVINKYFNESKEEYKPIPNVREDRMFVYILLLITFSNAFYEIQHSSTSEEVKLNVSKLRKAISQIIIEDLSPYIMSFLKWDLNRRVWKTDNDSYKIKYLNDVANDLDNELQGKKQLVKKYIKLFLEFIVAKYDEHILPHIDSQDFKQYQLDKDKVIKTRNQFEELASSNKLDEIIDDDAENTFLETYTPHADSYLSGLHGMLSRFDYLLYAFIEAQNDYKRFIGGILSSLQINEINEIKSALQNADIEKFITILRAIFASVPGVLIKNTTEAYYHIYIHIVLKLIGCDIKSEVSTNIGRIDAVLEFDKIVYIIEFKLSNAEDALKQIKDKHYQDSYMHLSKEIFLLGMSFDKIQKNVRNEFKLEKVK
jgi:hypothetical protein